MTNDQINAARRVMNQFPALTVDADDTSVTPVNGDTRGDTIGVSETTPPEVLSASLRDACVRLING